MLMYSKNERLTRSFDRGTTRMEVGGSEDSPPAVSTDSIGRLRGYAAVFNQWTRISSRFDERIMPGAFRDAIPRDDVLALYNHDRNGIIGRSKSGTLRLKEDEYGLLADIDLPATSLGRDIRQLVARGDVGAMSFGFTVSEHGTERDGDREKVSIIRVGRLFDVSVVVSPMYPQTSLSLVDDSASLLPSGAGLRGSRSVRDVRNRLVRVRLDSLGLRIRQAT